MFIFIETFPLKPPKKYVRIIVEAHIQHIYGKLGLLSLHISKLIHNICEEGSETNILFRGRMEHISDSAHLTF